MVEIIPAILVTTSQEFERRLRALEPFTNRIHLDISDGSFTPTITVNGFEELIAYPTEKLWDIHFMIRQPEQVMHDWYKTSADRFIFHVEVNHILRGLVEEAHLNGKKAGVAINPETPIEALDEVIEFVDFVQFMTVHPGAQGSPFLPDVINKMSMFHEQHPEIHIIADGGMNPDTGPQAAVAGAQTLVVGSYIFKSPSVKEAFDHLQALQVFGG